MTKKFTGKKSSGKLSPEEGEIIQDCLRLLLAIDQEYEDGLRPEARNYPDLNPKENIDIFVWAEEGKKDLRSRRIQRYRREISRLKSDIAGILSGP